MLRTSLTHLNDWACIFKDGLWGRLYFFLLMDAKTIYKSRKRKIIKCSFHHGGKNTFHASKAWFSSNSPNSSFSLLGSTGSCSLPVSSGRLLLTESIVSRVAVPFVSGSKKQRPAQTKASTATMEYGKRMWIRIYWENKNEVGGFYVWARCEKFSLTQELVRISA